MSDNVLQFRRPEGCPGEIADAEGAIWLRHRRKLSYGEVAVTLGQAGVADMFGWSIIEKSELFGHVLIKRSPPEVSRR